MSPYSKEIDEFCWIPTKIWGIGPYCRRNDFTRNWINCILFLTQFWKNVAYSPPLYGADLMNSLMEPCAGAWDLKNLDCILKEALSHVIKGVNSPYCYVGT